MTIPLPPSELDTECYPNYWSAGFVTGEHFETYPGKPLDVVGFAATLRKYEVYTFNGENYDMPLVCLALQGADCYDLKRASDQIIVGGARGYEICNTFPWINHVDLFNVAPGGGSLKAYGGKMHSRKLQDLPFDPSLDLTWEQVQALNAYRGNDLETTRDLRRAMRSQLQLRVEMSAEYGIDLRSKSDAQMAEAVMKKLLLPVKVVRPAIYPGTTFHYRPPAWMRFVNLDLLKRFESLPFVITDKGTVSVPYAADFIDWGDSQLRMSPHGRFVKRPGDWQCKPIRIGKMAYALGIGGLHSTESRACHVASDEYEITDHDVASYYPSLILQTGIFPQQIGVIFSEIYRSWYTRRLAAKARSEDKTLSPEERATAKKEANSLKTLLNGTFGKLGSMWSIFYAPSEMIQVTVGGQLCLLMLIEVLELNGIQVISANTDGIVLKTHKSKTALRAEIVKWWEGVTGLVTERSDYRMLASRDVNSYVAITLDGKAKLKGAFAPPEPGPSGWPNPTGQVSVDAVVAYLKDGTPLATTVRACTDVRQFVHVRAVKGGGSFCPNGSLPAAPTQIYMRKVVGDIKDKAQLMFAYSLAVACNRVEKQYLGKVVRWYYATSSRGCIVTPTDGLVARSEGCRPLMELPDVLPADVDHEWYIAEARAMLVDMGVLNG
jgi:hypothetical protein